MSEEHQNIPNQVMRSDQPSYQMALLSLSIESYSVDYGDGLNIDGARFIHACHESGLRNRDLIKCFQAMILKTINQIEGKVFCRQMTIV